MPDESPEFWAVFQRAVDIRKRLQSANETEAMEVKGRVVKALKQETFDLLHEVGLPHPLKMLIADLWGGPTFLDRPTAAMYVGAMIEGQHPEGALGLKKLSRLIHEELGDNNQSSNPDTYTRSIGRWRGEPEYQALVSSYRDGAQSDLPS